MNINELIQEMIQKEMPIGTWMGREPGDITPEFHYTDIKIS